MKAVALYRHIAGLVAAIENCRQSGNTVWLERHSAALAGLVKDHMPSGSGIDAGTTLGDSKPDKLVFITSFHHMNDAGMYDGWTEHKVIITPSLLWGFNVKVTGRNRNDIKNYLADIFNEALKRELER